MAKAYMPTPEELDLIREYLVIDETSKTGLRWAKAPNRKIKAGAEAITAINKDGYRQGRAAGKNMVAHRIVFFLNRGYWPAGKVDHIDGDKLNNLPYNLREVSDAVSAANIMVKGYTERGGKYRAHVEKDGKKYTKTFATPEAARRWYETMKRELYPEVDQWQWTQESAA